MLKRYTTDPFFVMDNFLNIGELTNFIDELIKKHNKETKEEIQWNYFLHKVYDKSYSDFASELENNKPEEKIKVPTEQEVLETLNKNKEIFNMFNNPTG